MESCETRIVGVGCQAHTGHYTACIELNGRASLA